MKVKIDDVLIALESVNDNLCFYYDTLEERLIYVLDGYINGDDDKNAEDILYDDRYIGLPDRYDIHDYQIMKDFAYSRYNIKDKKMLLQVLKGKGAFRRFKDAVYTLEQESEWYEFKKRKYINIAVKWCYDNHIKIDYLNKVKLKDIIDELEVFASEYTENRMFSYYDLFTNSFVTYDTIENVDQGYDEYNNYYDRYREIADYDVNVERIMCMFAKTLGKEKMHYLIEPLGQYQAFHNFYSRLYSLKVYEEFEEYLYNALRQKAIKWCEDNNLILEE